MDESDLKQLEQGIYLPEREGEGSRTSRSELRLIKRDREKTTIYMELREGRNRQIRRMMQRVGHPVKKLRRVKFGPIQLKGLAVGEWRELMSAELRTLRRAAGLLAPRPGHAPKAGAKTTSTLSPTVVVKPKSDRVGAGIDVTPNTRILSTAKARANPKATVAAKAAPVRGARAPARGTSAPARSASGAKRAPSAKAPTRGASREGPRSAPRGAAKGAPRGTARGGR